MNNTAGNTPADPQVGAVTISNPDAFCSDTAKAYAYIIEESCLLTLYCLKKVLALLANFNFPGITSVAFKPSFNDCLIVILICLK